MAGKDLIRYDLLVHEALRGVVRRILSDTARDGLAGEQHFYISFRTDFPGARLSNRLREKYPQEMTIVLQHQFWDLGVTEHAFEVGLSFSGVPERLLVPFEALTGFFDPSVQFGLKFTFEGADEEEEPEAPATVPRPAPPRTATRGAGSEPVELQPKKPAAPVPAMAPNPPARPKEKPPAPATAAEAAGEKPSQTKSEGEAEPAARIVSLDAFRKKN
jgi:hypothetical protein